MMFLVHVQMHPRDVERLTADEFNQLLIQVKRMDREVRKNA